MPDEKPKAHDLTTKQLAERLFPKEAREAVALEAKKPKPGRAAGKVSTKKDSS
jgi:hypothetical protein